MQTQRATTVYKSKKNNTILFFMETEYGTMDKLLLHLKMNGFNFELF